MLKMTIIKQEVDQVTGDWSTVSEQVRDITDSELDRLIDSMPFFRRLGGTEKFTGDKLVSTSPDCRSRTIRIFEGSNINEAR